MMHIVQRVVVNIPLSRKEELFKFIEEKSKGLGIICILLSDIVFVEASDLKKVNETAAKQFEMFIEADKVTVQRFIESLFKHHKVPDGKQWKVFGPTEHTLIDGF